MGFQFPTVYFYRPIFFLFSISRHGDNLAQGLHLKPCGSEVQEDAKEVMREVQEMEKQSVKWWFSCDVVLPMVLN